jgi:hypothetical protein
LKVDFVPAMKPLDVLEIVNAGATVFRRNLVALLTIALLAYLPNVPLTVIATHLSQQAQSEGNPFSVFTKSMLSAGIMWVIQLTWSSVLLVAMFRYVSDYLNGKSPDIMGAIGSSFERFFPVVFTKVLIGLIAGAVLVAGLFVIGIFFVLWFLIGWALVNPVMAAEGCYYLSALRRSWKLMFGYPTEPGGTPTYLRYISLYLTFVLISFVLGLVAGLPQLVFTLRSTFQKDISQMMNPPLAITLTGAILQTVVEAAVTGFFACAIFIFYTDLKVRFESPPAVEPTPAEPPEPTITPSESPPPPPI